MKNANRLLVIVVTLQALCLATLWTAHSLPTAQAQIPDSGAQLERQIDELKALNAKTDKLLELLAGGKLQVQVQRVDSK